MTADQTTIRHLTEAHALEGALLQTLGTHLSITPRSEYRDLLERHAAETRRRLDRVTTRLGELGEGPNPLQLAYGVAQTAIAQLLAVSRFPLELLRGTGGEEKLLANAKDEAAAAAMVITTYDALEALAQAGADTGTAELARDHRTQEEAVLRDLRAVIGQLARDVAGAGGIDPGGSAPLDIAAGAIEAARAMASEVRDVASRLPTPSPAPASPPAAPAKAEDPALTADLPIEDYDELTVQQIIPKLRLLTATGLARVEAHEREGRGRKRILERVAKLRSQANGSRPQAPR